MKTLKNNTVRASIILLFVLLSASPLFASSQPYISGHGINFSTGNKYLAVTDLSLGGSTPLTFKRTYNSQSTKTGIFGYGWTTSLTEYLINDNEPEKLILVQPGGRHVYFFYDNITNTWTNENGKVRSIIKDDTSYQLSEPNGNKRIFNLSGKIVEKRDHNNKSIFFTYSGDLLNSVADTLGRSLTLSYNANNRLESLSTPIGSFIYTYDANDNLKTVTKPDNTTRTYLFEDPADAHNLTGIINEAGNLILTVTYDADDRVTSSAKADDTDSYTIEYLPNLQRKITDSLGVSSTYQLEVMHGVVKVKSFTGPGCSACGADTGSTYTYNSRQQIEQVVDAKGHITTYQYDAKGNRIAKTEAAGTTVERSRTWTYDPAINKVATITKYSVSNPGQQSVTTMSYDGNGNLLSRTETGYDVTTPISRATTYTYDTYGRIETIDGPRTDVNDVTTFTYYPSTADQINDCENLHTVTNALGHVTTYSNYNAFGKAGLITTPNGTVSFTYDVLGRLLTRNNSGISQNYTYDPTGLLTRIDLPDNRYVTYTYNTNGTILSIKDNLDNSITYTYDTKGNKTKESVNDPNGTLTRFVDYTYEETGDLDKTILADGSTENLNYDMVGNLVQRINAAGSMTSYTYDALNRLTTMIEPGDIVTGYAYDVDDNLKSVTDAENHTTSFSYDDFGRKIYRFSPDTGQTFYAYDAAGNLISKADANGITVNHEYDALNRLLAVRYPDSSLDVTQVSDLFDSSHKNMTTC